MPRSSLSGCLLTTIFRKVHASSCSSQYVILDTESNSMAIATMLFGSLSVVLCLLVIAVILGHKKDRHFLRERIMLGLMVANCVYSAANIAPVWYIDSRSCNYVLTEEEDVWVRGVWFWGKYWMVFYEIMIVCTSIMALQLGTVTLPTSVEILSHIACFLAGAAVFAKWCFEMVPNGRRRVDLVTEVRTIFAYVDDDAGNCYEALADERRFDELNLQYQNYTTHVLRMWFIPLFASVILWVASRLLYHRLLSDWHQDLAAAQQAWESELWAANTRNRLFNLRREAYKDVVKPLEPYVVVFVLFAVPAVVMSTDRCIALSNKDHYCQLPCEMVLSLRSLATAGVYFLDRTHRNELFTVSNLCQKAYVSVLA